MSDRNEKISVVIPVYRSEESLEPLTAQLTTALNEMGYKQYEIIFVDDASPDGSWEVIKKIAAQYPSVFGSRLMRNRGQAFATLCGLHHATGDIVITMDDDLQHRPDQLSKLLNILHSEPDIDCVFGYFEEKKHAAYRNLGSSVIRWVNIRSFGLPPNVRSSSFRVMRKSVAGAILRHNTQNPAIATLIYSSTRRIKSVPVEHAERYAGQTNYTLTKQFRLAFDNICNVSMLPLRAVSVLGFIICVFSVLLVLIFLHSYLTGQVGVAGWTTIVILVSFFSGTILLSLGIIGEYLVRVLREVRGSPPFVEREWIGKTIVANDSDKQSHTNGRI